MFAWQLAGPQGLAQTRARSWPGALSSIQELSVFGGEPGEVSFEPDVAVDDSGAAVYAWGQYTQAGGSAAAGAGSQRARPAESWARSATSRRSWAASTTSTSTPTPKATPSSSGRPTWAPSIRSRRGPGPRMASGGRCWSCRRPARTPPGPQVAVDADGDAIFTWQRLDGTSYRAEARALSAAGVLELDRGALVDALDLDHPAGRGQPGRRRLVRLAQHRPRRRRGRPHRDEGPPGWGHVYPQADGGRRPGRRQRPAGRDRRRRRRPVRVAAVPGLPAVAQGPPSLRARRTRRSSRRSGLPPHRSRCRLRGCRWTRTATR